MIEQLIGKALAEEEARGPAHGHVVFRAAAEKARICRDFFSEGGCDVRIEQLTKLAEQARQRTLAEGIVLSPIQHAV